MTQERLFGEATPKRKSSYRWHTELMHKHGISPEGYEALLRVSDGGCAICGGQNVNGKRLGVDHCHETGTIRGLLCDNCNFGLGHFKDDPRRLREALRYIEGALEFQNGGAA